MFTRGSRPSQRRHSGIPSQPLALSSHIPTSPPGHNQLVVIHLHQPRLKLVFFSSFTLHVCPRAQRFPRVTLSTAFVSTYSTEPQRGTPVSDSDQLLRNHLRFRYVSISISVLVIPDASLPQQATTLEDRSVPDNDFIMAL